HEKPTAGPMLFQSFLYSPRLGLGLFGPTNSICIRRFRSTGLSARRNWSKHRDPSLNRRWSQTVVLIRRSVELISHSNVEREGWIDFPIVFEENRPIV